MAKEQNPTRVMLKNVRLSYPHIFKPQESDDGGKPRYSATFLIRKDTPEGKKAIEAMEDAIDAAKAAKWGNKIPKFGDDKLCLRDGDDKEDESYQDCMYVSAARGVEQPRMHIIDRDKSPLTVQDGKPYAGCFVNAIVSIYGYAHEKHGKRVCASIEGIQFYKDGEAFGVAPVDADEFDDLSDEDEKPARKSDRPEREERRSSRDDRDNVTDLRSRRETSRRDRDEEDEQPRRKAAATRGDSRRPADDEEDF